MTKADHLAELRAQARYRRERLAVYRAKVHGPHPTSPARLEQLTREYELAVSSLERARAPSVAVLNRPLRSDWDRGGG